MTELERALLHIKTKADAWAVKEVEKALSQEPTDTWSIKDVADTFKKHGIIGEQQPCTDAVSRQAAQAKIKSICDEYRLSYEDGERKAATGGSAYALGHAFDDLPPVTQKPSECGDAISRDMALEKMADYVASGYADSVEDFEEYSRIICQLPPVTQKSGTWIDYRDDGFVECPFCGHATNCEDNIDELHYCFYCGAKMESEDKE